jgi:hypothetical protein
MTKFEFDAKGTNILPTDDEGIYEFKAYGFKGEELTLVYDESKAPGEFLALIFESLVTDGLKVGWTPAGDDE